LRERKLPCREARLSSHRRTLPSGGRTVLLFEGSFLLSKGSFLLFEGSFLLSKGSFLLFEGSFLLSEGSFLLFEESFLLSEESFLLSKGSFLLFEGSLSSGSEKKAGAWDGPGRHHVLLRHPLPPGRRRVAGLRITLRRDRQHGHALGDGLELHARRGDGRDVDRRQRQARRASRSR
jgi:hypothetical protein